MGNWTRANAELCLLATKGKPKRKSASVHSIVETPIEKHSKKPNEVRNRIVELCGDLPRIELFARETTEGWDVFGNEVTKYSIKGLDKSHSAQKDFNDFMQKQGGKGSGND
jgi:N6-adenosine-specific RNA methylase IME4